MKRKPAPTADFFYRLSPAYIQSLILILDINYFAQMSVMQYIALPDRLRYIDKFFEM